MTVSIFFGVTFLVVGLLSLSKNFINTICSLREKGSSSKMFVSSAILIVAICLLGIVFQNRWTEVLWQLVVFIFLFFILVQLLSIFVYPKFFKLITSTIRNTRFLERLAICLLLSCLGFLLIGRSYVGPVPAINDCESDKDINVLCVLTNPEDIAVTPDGNFLIVSEFGGIEPLEEMIPGNLALLNLESLTKSSLTINYSDQEWGEESCIRSEETQFGPHGIDLLKRTDGRFQLAVVNHVGGESIEMFELLNKETQWMLEWKGCVKPSADKYLNDVSLQSDGSFFVTHMYDRESTIGDFLAIALFKYDTGYVLHWNSERGLQKVPNSDGAMPNGLAYDEKNDVLYINFNLGDKVTSLKASTGEHISSRYLNSPDNLYLKNNSIWVTTLDHEILDVVAGCGLEFHTTCPLPFSVYELSSDNLDIKKKDSFKESVFGLPTVAVPVGDKIWLGSFNSNRIAFYYF